jgi:putative glutamine amidotransferase
VLPLVAVAGRLTPKAEGLRTEAVALGRPYLHALRRAGAEGVVLLPDAAAVDRVPEVLARFDGLLLAGGGDLDPATYGATPQDEVYGVSHDHDAFELALLRAAVEQGRPVLAICRGLQLLNVAQGGTLFQHITDGETTVHHRGHLHALEVSQGCRLAAAVGAGSLDGWSMHHQAVARLGLDLVVTARAADGVIEGVELPDGWVVGVQWHPEDTAAEDPLQQRLFDAFAAACSARSTAGSAAR